MSTATVLADDAEALALFEMSGTRSAVDFTGLHRHWRDARTHALHDPARWESSTSAASC